MIDMTDEKETAPEAPEAESGNGASGENIEEELNKAKEMAARFEDNWKRAAADLQNYKRRAEQERDEARRFAGAAILQNLLPVMDDFERAFATLEPRLRNMTWFDGMALIYRKLEMLLQNSGVKPIEAMGQKFDPRYHEAVQHVDGEEGKVVAEVQRGYMLGDRVLRPAMVVVGKGTTKEEGSGKKEEEKEDAGEEPRVENEREDEDKTDEGGEQEQPQ